MYFSDITVADVSQEFYPQDGGECHLASKLRHCHPLYRSETVKTLAVFCQSTFTTDQCNDPHREVDSFEPNDIMTYILGAGSPYLYPEDQGYRSRFKVK